MAVTPNAIVTPQTLKSGTAVPITANTTMTDSPTNSLVLVTAGSNGARVTKISAIPRMTVTACQLQLYRDGDGTGTAKRLFDSALMAAYTMAATTEAPVNDFGYSDTNPITLAPGEKIYAAIGVGFAAGVCFQAEWADY
jgi:hypothetical protein